MAETKDELAEQMYRNLDITCDGDFDFERDHDEFIRAFKRVLHDYSLIPTVEIIE